MGVDHSELKLKIFGAEPSEAMRRGETFAYYALDIYGLSEVIGRAWPLSVPAWLAYF